MLLPTRLVEKPWGKDILPAPFAAPAGQRIGEIWFEPPAALPELLVKYIFTSQALSVQVHPSDAQTFAAGIGQQGKEECWLVIDAEPGARLGIGFRDGISAAAMRAAALDGSIEKLLTWHEVRAGDFFYIPANTVHAIGGGVSIIEIQQNSDITYRLYDYGRPRELHLDDAIAVAQTGPIDSACTKQVPATGSMVLVDGPVFRLDQVQGATDALAAAYPAALLIIPRTGACTVADEMVQPGQCALAASLAEVHIPPASVALLARPVAR